MQADPEWGLERGRAAGRQIGIASEDDVERLCDEYRQPETSN
jgi:hypothetical protein